MLHLHGEITKAKSSIDDSLIYDIGYEPINIGQKCIKGYQIRPDVVWFGEAVPMMDQAYLITSKADVFIVIGSSLNVYPAAHLCQEVPNDCECYLIDPNASEIQQKSFKNIEDKASIGVPKLLKELIKKLVF